MPFPQALDILLLASASLASASLLAQSPERVDRIPDPVKLAPAAVVYVNPLHRPVDVAPKVIQRPNPEDLETMCSLAITLKLDEAGRVVDSQAVEPPVQGLTAPLPALIPKWRFTPARKDGRPVATWATYLVDLSVELEKATFTSFGFQVVGKEDPLPAVVRESEGDRWMERYPREITPKDLSVVSVEQVDVLPSPDKTKWDFDSVRVASTVRALVEVASTGSIRRLVPIGGGNDRLVVVWVRRSMPAWKLTPAQQGGKAVDCWMMLETTIEYTIGSAKDRARRMVKKNLRGTPAD